MYYKKIKEFQKKIIKYSTEIFKVYGNELMLKLEDYNLLSNKNNCLESSTAIGFIIEEFLVSKLEIYSKNHKNDDFKIERNTISTTNSSYDCYSNVNNNLKSLINIKACKNSNNAISAINILYKDYVETDKKLEKCFLILKINYLFLNSKKDNENKIFIKNIDSFFLEEIDFNLNHKQDNRNWSENFNKNSGRLQVSDNFRKNNQVDIKNISYKNTCDMLKKIVERNKSEK